MRMEWRALAAALNARSDADRARAITDALTFRAWRRQGVSGAANLENQLELNEGLAEYTGRKLSGQDSLEIAAALANAEKGASFVRSFAYASGPAYGFLLDTYDNSWRKQLTTRSDLGVMLARAAHVSVPNDITASANAAGGRYGLADVYRQEQGDARQHEKQAKQWIRQLVHGPVLHLAFNEMKIEFNPNNLFPLPPFGTVYPTLQIIDAWGTLSVDGGALIDDRWSSVTVAAPRHGAVTGKGWILKLNDGWMLRPGERPGDFTIAKALGEGS